MGAEAVVAVVPGDRFIGWRLVSPDHDLHDYLFTSEKHKDEWLAQKFVTDRPGMYRAELVTYRKRKCCGKPFSFRVVPPAPTTTQDT